MATPRSIYPLSTFARSILFQLKVKSGLNGVYLIKLRFLFCFNTRFYVFSVSTKDTECESFSLLEKGTPTFARKNSSGEIALKYEVSFENITQQVDSSSFHLELETASPISGEGVASALKFHIAYLINSIDNTLYLMYKIESE